MAQALVRRFHLFAAILLLGACTPDGRLFDEKSDPLDRPLDLTREDYKNLTKPKALEGDGELVIEAKTGAPPIPSIAPILASPRPPKIANAQLVSITVTDDVPLKDVLIELARLADVDIELDAGIEGGVNFRAKDKPFNDVIERIANLAGLRYTMKSGVLRVERDEPYVKNYNLDFLNMVRSSDTSIKVETDVASIADSALGSGGSAEGGGESGGGTEGVKTGSTTEVTMKAKDDFWESLSKSIKQILNYKVASGISENKDAAADAAEAAAAQQAEQAAASAEGAEGSFTGKDGSYFVLNRQAGMLSVSASERQHEMVEDYIARLRGNASAQVLIEAKIVEVDLKDDYKTGIDWSSFEAGATIQNTYLPDFDATNVTTLTLGSTTSELSAAVKLVEKFGTSRTLSSPRLHAINNQLAILTFAENRVFFDVQITQDDAQVVDGVLIPGNVTVTSQRLTVPIGIIMNILPSIDTERGEVTLNIRPTLSRQVGSVVDPGSAVITQILQNNGGNAPDFTNEVPVVEVRELDSILRVKSGQVMIIGGLMEQSSGNTDSGVPFISRTPWLGNLFKGVEKSDHMRELVFFIRATIVSPRGSYQDADKAVYRKFTDDPRPLDF